jgi:hypothetical protein
MDRLNTKDLMSRKHWHIEGGVKCVLCTGNDCETRDISNLSTPSVIRCGNNLEITWDNSRPITDDILLARRIFTGPCFFEIFVCAAWNISKARHDFFSEGSHQRLE